MSLLVKKLSEPEQYFKFDLKLVESEKLSVEAKMVYVYAASRPPGWKIYACDIQKRLHLGANRVSNAIKELREQGLFEISQERDAETQKFTNKVWCVLSRDRIKTAYNKVVGRDVKNRITEKPDHGNQPSNYNHKELDQNKKQPTVVVDFFENEEAEELGLEETQCLAIAKSESLVEPFVTENTSLATQKVKNPQEKENTASQTQRVLNTEPPEPLQAIKSNPVPKSKSVKKELVSLMITQGMLRCVAETLAEECPEEVIRNQVAWLLYRKYDDPGAFLKSAIQRNYSPPKEIKMQLEEVEKQKCKEREKATQEMAQSVFKVGQKLKTPSGKIAQIRLIMTSALGCLCDGIFTSIPFNKALSWEMVHEVI